MKVSVILAGVLLLLLYSGSTFPIIAINWNFLVFDVQNPLNMVASIVLFNLLGFALTLGWVVLGLAVLFLIVGLLT